MKGCSQLFFMEFLIEVSYFVTLEMHIKDYGRIYRQREGRNKQRG